MNGIMCGFYQEWGGPRLLTWSPPGVPHERGRGTAESAGTPEGRVSSPGRCAPLGGDYSASISETISPDISMDISMVMACPPKSMAISMSMAMAASPSKLMD